MLNAAERFTIVLLALCSTWSAHAFVVNIPATTSSISCVVTRTSYLAATTIEAPPRESTERRTGRQSGEKVNRNKNNNDDSNMIDDTIQGTDYDDLEYLIDSAEAREMDDPFHILLLGSTFDKPKITVPYCAGSLEYVLAMPRMEAEEMSQFAKDNGLCCLGTWSREECLQLGRQLQIRDLVCRVVPFVEGGQRGWQAKDASESSFANRQDAQKW